MRERVFVRRGKLHPQVLLVAPHGSDDKMTVTLAKHAAECLDCHAVINQGFDRSSSVDVVNDKADCNRIDHIKQDVVFDEFLKPVINVVAAYRRHAYYADPNTIQPLLILHIHGAGNAVHKEANEPVACIVGCGLGNNKDSITCQPWRTNLFIESMRNYIKNGAIYTGKGGGKYAGRDSNNLNQYFVKHQFEPLVDSLQLEFPFSMRNSDDVANRTAEMLSYAVIMVLQSKSYHKITQHKFI